MRTISQYFSFNRISSAKKSVKKIKPKLILILSHSILFRKMIHEIVLIQF